MSATAIKISFFLALSWLILFVTNYFTPSLFLYFYSFLTFQRFFFDFSQHVQGFSKGNIAKETVTRVLVLYDLLFFLLLFYLTCHFSPVLHSLFRRVIYQELC